LCRPHIRQKASRRLLTRSRSRALSLSLARSRALSLLDGFIFLITVGSVKVFLLRRNSDSLLPQSRKLET
jgi:hypothetical protein